MESNTPKIEARVKALEGRVPTLETDVSTLKNDVTKLKSDVVSLDNRVDILDEKVVSATISREGLVQLNNTVSSTSEIEAATASAVKMAYDKAVIAENAANNAKIASALSGVTAAIRERYAFYAPSGGTWWCFGEVGYSVSSGADNVSSYNSYVNKRVAGGASIFALSHTPHSFGGNILCIRMA